MILLQDYLEKQLPVFRHIIECAGALLEKNAMNYAPTPEELAQIQNGAEEIRQNLEQMEKDAAIQAKLYEEKVNSADICIKQTTDRLTAVYAEFDRLKEQQTAEEIELERITRESENERENLAEKQKDLAEYRRRQAEALRAREKKRQEAIKWCWVPGYNIYLACDYAVEISNGKVETLEHQCANCKKAVEEFENRAREAEKRIEEISGRRDELSTQCGELKRKSVEYQEMLLEYKSQLVYWEDMRVKISDLKSRLSAGFMAPDDLMELMDMMEMFGKGI